MIPRVHKSSSNKFIANACWTWFLHHKEGVECNLRFKGLAKGKFFVFSLYVGVAVSAAPQDGNCGRLLLGFCWCFICGRGVAAAFSSTSCMEPLDSGCGAM
jgi:hypothetical protein